MEDWEKLDELFKVLPKGPIVVPSWGSDLESYKVTPKRNYYGAYGYLPSTL